MEAEEGRKKRRKEIYEKGHVKVPKLGQNPEEDARERRMMKLATKYGGVGKTVCFKGRDAPNPTDLSVMKVTHKRLR